MVSKRCSAKCTCLIFGILGALIIGGCAQNSTRLDFDVSTALGPAPLVVRFTPVTSAAIQSAAWSFGDGTTSTETSPTHTYANAGLYDVTLTVVFVGGSISTMTKSGVVRVTGEISPLLFWSERGSGTISSGERDGTNRETIVDGLISPEDLTVVGSRIYWTDYGTGRVESANLDGAGRHLIASGLHSPTGIAVDDLRAKVYWTCLPGSLSETDPLPGCIQSANLDGTSLETLVSFSSDEAFAWQIAVDPLGEKLFWISLDWQALDAGTCDGQVIMAELDGGNPVAIVTGICEPTDLAIDGAASMAATCVYWTSEDPGTLSRASLDGGVPAVLVSGIPGAESLAVDSEQGRLYWTAGTVLQQATVSGASISTIYSGLSLPEGVAVGR